MNRQQSTRLIATGAFATSTILVAVASGPKPDVTSDDVARSGGVPGHPTFHAPPNAGAGERWLSDLQGAQPFTPRGGGSGLQIPPLSPQETGSYVNFESPPVKALALTSEGDRLYAVDTPLNALLVYDTNYLSQDLLHLEKTIPVGIDPVTVVVRPNTEGNEVWTANYISDTISVIDTVEGRVLATLPAGDEPSTIAFSPDGTIAWVVFEGNAPTVEGELIQPTPALGIYDAVVRQFLGWVPIPANTPRSMVLDPTDNRLYIAAVRSGNNTTAAGVPLFLAHDNGDPDEFVHMFEILRDFSLTAGIFASSPLLSPWPDASPTPNAPLVMRALEDTGGVWDSIVDVFTLPDGTLDPATVATLAAEFGISNATTVADEIANEVHDTLDNDVLVFNVDDPTAPALDSIVSDVGTFLTGMERNPVNGDLFVLNMEALNLPRLEPNLRGHFVDHEVVVIPTRGPNPMVPNASNLHQQIPGFNNVSSGFNAAAWNGSIANPIDVVFNSEGTRAYVASLGTGRVAVLNAASTRVLTTIDVGRGTRSLAYDRHRQRLYALNRTDDTIVAINVGTDAPMIHDVIAMFNPEPQDIKEGRDFLFTTNISFNNSSSCAVCHIDGHLGGLAWDLGDPNAGLLPAPSNVVDGQGNPLMNHPLKGIMVTMSLRGLRDHNAFHWRGDKPTFEDFNSAFDGLLGGAEITDAEMTDYREFIDTVAYPPNPFYNRDNSFKDPRSVNGAVVFINNCAGCHTLEKNGTLRLAGFDDDAGMSLQGPPFFAQLQEVTQLRQIHRKFDMDIYNGFGLVHDGRDRRKDDPHPMDSFLDFAFPNIVGQDRADMIAFMNGYQSNVQQVVGWEIYIDPASVNTRNSDVDLLVAQSLKAPSHCDVVARGMIDGAQRGFVMEIDPDSLGPIYRSDTNTMHTQAELLGFASVDGNYLVFEGVPIGSGYRMGIDADEDCLLNGLEAFPYATPDKAAPFGVYNTSDLVAFLNLHASSSPLGDFNGDRFFNTGDLIAFLNNYVASQGQCP